MLALCLGLSKCALQNGPSDDHSETSEASEDPHCAGKDWGTERYWLLFLWPGEVCWASSSASVCCAVIEALHFIGNSKPWYWSVGLYAYSKLCKYHTEDRTCRAHDKLLTKGLPIVTVGNCLILQRQKTTLRIFSTTLKESFTQKMKIC